MAGGGMNWRDTYRPARLFKIDARIMFLLVPTLVHARLYTIIPTILAAGVLYYFEKRREMLVPGALRMIRHWIAGDERPARPRIKRRFLLDYGRVGP